MHCRLSINRSSGGGGGGIAIPKIYREIALLFSVANSNQEFYALLITMGGVRDDVGSEKHAKNLQVFIWRKAVSKYFHLDISKL